MAGLFTRIDTVILRVKNIKKARKWYEEVLELTPTFVGDDDYPIVIYKVGGETPLTLYQLGYDEVLPAKRFSTTYPIFFVENIEEAHSKLHGRGVDVEAIQDDGTVQYFVFRDPDGNRMEACHWE
ncbi:VOC family protein [Effusibacillus lacus]|uniref:Glyoxalase/bleomycin resistance/dioxygenase family protein n=1 Tax=Effusibacillus lacus TaxID=1348429 RepID=A0A292YRX3_9BACL|nr:VOC family protein [Effusibacillus lacus]TCS76877.1 glyoxalase/bleomycin resistance protein/dioxygenase superfamily protein [Effusibacillus lacus]GAX91210.1 glyoxalase/bleomycin resistance/dioxygenase family protein [Effusibacillus lacus]